MALQGDLSSFALPDVLRLLAGTAKTGRLAVAGEQAAGELWLRDGRFVGGSVNSSPHANQAADLVFELLRFDGGSFLFDDGDQLVDGTEAVDVEEALAVAEQLAAEWAEVEAVVPSVRSWVSLAREISDEVTVTPHQWMVLAALGAGCTVEDLSNRFELTDLAASRQVKVLVEARLVDIGEAPQPVETALSTEAHEAHDDAFEPYEAHEAHLAHDAESLPEPHEAHEAHEAGSWPELGSEPLSVNDAYARDLALLSAEDGPVVLESSDDAHLPEPLPGEGTSFVGELGPLAVDGRSIDAQQVEAQVEAGAAPAYDEAEVHHADTWSSYGSFGDPEPAPVAEAPRSWEDVISEESFADIARPEPVEEPAPAASEDTDGTGSDDRGSLLRFLSSVKP